MTLAYIPFPTDACQVGPTRGRAVRTDGMRGACARLSCAYLRDRGTNLRTSDNNVQRRWTRVSYFCRNGLGSGT